MRGGFASAPDDAANAEKWLLESVRARPDRILEDLGGQETTKRAILFLVDKHMRRNDLAKVEAISRAVAEAANGDVDFLNNAGLFARDLGVQLERDGKQAEAAAMFEQSYKAYRRAQELDPSNVRLRNDCALIAIHHLGRDWELAKQMLDGAIADGERTLRESPPDDPNEKQQLEEAVGDCYENLALWQLRHGGDAAAAKAAAQQSMKFHPRERRPGARRHLGEAERRLQGK
jgi:tetratricopeptide (TPR) repeat protein